MEKPSNYFKKLDLAHLDVNTAQFIREKVLTLINIDILEGTKEFETIKAIIEENFPRAIGLEPKVENVDSECLSNKKNVLNEISELINEVEFDYNILIKPSNQRYSDLAHSIGYFKKLCNESEIDYILTDTLYDLKKANVNSIEYKNKIAKVILSIENVLGYGHIEEIITPEVIEEVIAPVIDTKQIEIESITTQVSEMSDLIELMNEVVAENKDDLDSKDILELYNDTLIDLKDKLSKLSVVILDAIEEVKENIKEVKEIIKTDVIDSKGILNAPKKYKTEDGEEVLGYESDWNFGLNKHLGETVVYYVSNEDNKNKYSVLTGILHKGEIIYSTDKTSNKEFENYSDNESDALKLAYELANDKEAIDKYSLGGVLLGVALGVAGTIGFQKSVSTSNMPIKKEKVISENLPSKIRFYDDGKDIKTRVWEKHNDTTNKWEFISEKEYSKYFVLEKNGDEDKPLYNRKKKSEGGKFVYYLTDKFELGGSINLTAKEKLEKLGIKYTTEFGDKNRDLLKKINKENNGGAYVGYQLNTNNDELVIIGKKGTIEFKITDYDNFPESLVGIKAKAIHFKNGGNVYSIPYDLETTGIFNVTENNKNSEVKLYGAEKKDNESYSFYQNSDADDRNKDFTSISVKNLAISKLSKGITVYGINEKNGNKIKITRISDIFKQGGDVKSDNWLKGLNEERLNELKEERVKIEKEMPEDFIEVDGGSGRNKSQILADFDEAISERENKVFKDGGSIGFIPMDLEEKLSWVARYGGIRIIGVIGILSAMIDAGITKDDLKLEPANTTLRREKRDDAKRKELWAKSEPFYKGDLKGNMYYSTMGEIIRKPYLLDEFRTWRKTQKFKDGGKISGEIVLNEGNGIVINELYNNWQKIKTEKEHDEWSDLVKKTKFGTYGTIGIFEVLKKFEPKFPNEIIKRDFTNELKKALDVSKDTYVKFENGGGVDDNKFTYMMLGRLQSDNDYFLGYGNRGESSLWAGNVDKQIEEMKRLWNSLPEDAKPEWLSMEDILDYEIKMKGESSDSDKDENIAKIRFNGAFKKVQLFIDGSLYGEFDTYQDAVKDAENNNSKVIMEDDVTMLTISESNPLSNQLVKLTGETWNTIDFVNLDGGNNLTTAKPFKHIASGKIFEVVKKII